MTPPPSSSPPRRSTSASSTPAATSSRKASRSPISPSATTESSIWSSCGPLFARTPGSSNEIGVIQPLEEIGRICKELKVPFHTDAAQALGKIPIDVEKWNVSLMSLCGQKVYGPKGVGDLYIRRRPRIRMEP
ncbi:hypothetical protein Tsubulata_019916 [Turnera subulata]|uniref:Aminotransferase class V domain-containing protein n=1 Tax=Turnera subulata TaxID=218843 RepID=A0A9Q0JQE6_9ROSI|nr:hypothetical protein Tsubulata_019916 [Turnera subulata]